MEPNLDQRYNRILDSVVHIMDALGLDLTDDSLERTPHRIAKMFTREVFSGLFTERPRMMAVENKFNFDQMLTVSNIEFSSMCEHHFMPFIGYAHVAYIPNDKILGLSKFNRLVQWCAKRPQVQERLTSDIANNLVEILGTLDVAVVIDALHTCVRSRGVEDSHSVTRTTSVFGKFRIDQTVRQEFLSGIPSVESFRL